MKYDLNERELATVLAALRLWEIELALASVQPKRITTPLMCIATNNSEFQPMRVIEIGVLVERLNFEQPGTN